MGSDNGAQRLIQFLRAYFKDLPECEVQQILEAALDDKYVLIMPKKRT